MDFFQISFQKQPNLIEFSKACSDLYLERQIIPAIVLVSSVMTAECVPGDEHVAQVR